MTALIIGVMALAVVGHAQMPRQVKVIIDNASIRSKPELDAEILDTAAEGTVFDVIEQTGEWYAIRMGEDEAGQTVRGFIHESMVEPGEETLPPPPEREKPPPAQKPQVVPPPPEARTPPPPHRKFLAGSFLKYGFNDHWVASFGYDYGIGRYFGLGLEFQPYVRSLSTAASTTIQMDVFVNLKLGFRIWFLTFYGGGGVGPDFQYTSAEIEGETSSQFKTRVAYHGIAGAAIHIGKIAVVFEYQPTWIREPGVSPDAQSRVFFIGLRF